METTEKKDIKRDKTFLLRLSEAEHEQLRYESFKTRKSINQIIIDRVFSKENKNNN